MGGISYYSTNRNINEAGFTPFKDLVSFKDALMMGQAPDAGLFMPERMPNFSRGEIEDLRGKRYFEIAHTVLEKFLYADIDSDYLLSICRKHITSKFQLRRYMTENIY